MGPMEAILCQPGLNVTRQEFWDLEALEAVVADRISWGCDSLDERWEGVWHFVNPPKMWHALLSTPLLRALSPIADRLGLLPFGEGVGIFGAEIDWRMPDQVYVRPEDIREEGVVSAAFVVEIRSPRDESYEKLPFYASCGVDEVLIVHQDRHFDFYLLGPHATYVEAPDGESFVFGVTFSTVQNEESEPRLRIATPNGNIDV